MTGNRIESAAVKGSDLGLGAQGMAYSQTRRLDRGLKNGSKPEKWCCQGGQMLDPAGSWDRAMAICTGRSVRLYLDTLSLLWNDASSVGRGP